MIDSLSSLPSANLPTATAANGKSNASLQMDDFLQLLTSQITNQDPLEPMKDTEFISQMANIASLEQMEQFSKGFSRFADSQHAMLAQGYLGHEVKIRENDQEISGIVESINNNEDGTAEIVVNGNSYSPGSIKEVKLVQKQ